MKVNYLFPDKETIQYVLCKSPEKPSIVTFKSYRYICILSLNTSLQIYELIQKSRN